MDLTRRDILWCGPLLAVGLSFGAAGCRPEASCAGELTTAEKQLRESLAYTEPSADDRVCSDCQFFEADDVARCGRCSILNGAVAADASCRSWAARA